MEATTTPQNVHNNVHNNNTSTTLTGLSTAPGGGPSSLDGLEKPPKWQLDLIMEKLRQKSVLLKPLGDTSKNIRQALMERRCIIDQNDKANLQKSLDSLQQSLRVNSLQSMVERLEMVARQLGLRFTPGGTGHEWFIHSDMFYLELLIDSNGMVEDVKIQHEGKTEQQSCPEIVESLKKTDFQDFTAHLEGLVSIYQLTADKKIKSKAYIALQCLEADLASISSSYSHIADAETVIMKSLLGLLQPRKGGHPVKLVYFISPYEFLDVTTKSMLTNDVNTVLFNKLGSSATIHIQASTSHKLQMSTTVNLTRTPDGKSIPRYGTLNATNSTLLPACFVLNLSKPVPICVDLLKAIHSTTEIDSFDLSYTEPILNLVAHQLSNGTLNCSENGLFVALPDQVHCYFMTETPNLEGIMVSSICFTLASQLPQVVAILRQQVAFNTLVGSCVRVGCKPELNHIVFEVNALSHQKLSVSFQHPLDDSLVTLEFDLRDVTHPHCHLHAVSNATDIIPTLEEHACKVVKRSMSIPITLRAVIRRWQSMKVKADLPNPDFSVAVGGLNNMDVSSRLNDRSCGAESVERRSNSSTSHQQMVPPGIINFNNISNTAAGNNSGAKHPISTTSSYSISPINNYNANQSPQSPMDILSYMNPFLNLPNQMNMAGAASFPNITPNMAMQMLASQMSQNPNSTSSQSQMLMGLLDQVQTQKRRKRKNTTENLPSPSPKASPGGGGGSSNRPNQSPSRPSSTLQQNKSPIRRQSDSSDGSGADKTAMLMNELGVDQLPDSRWNIDITPVNTSSSESIDDLDSFKKQMTKKTTPKRSMSLDSHSSEDISSIQSLMDGHEFKPLPPSMTLVTPSLSITPVSTTSTSSTVNSLLASIRPGIEIIPLPNNTPVSIPTSLTVTPITTNNNNKSNNPTDRQDKPPNSNNKKPKDRTIPGKRKLDNSGDQQGGDGRPSKLPFFDSKGRISPNINLTKKPSSPNLMNMSSSPSKQVQTSQGKPSVSTLAKSVSSPTTPNSPSSKVFGENNTTTTTKQKIKKLSQQKGITMNKGFVGFGSIPQLKALSSTTLLPSPAGVSKQQIQQQQQQQESTASSSSSSGGMVESPRSSDVKLMSHAQAAVTAALQQAAASLANNAVQKPQIPKKGGLAAVIDKLKSELKSSSTTEGPQIPGGSSSGSGAGPSSGGGGNNNNSGIGSAGADKKETSATTMSAKDYLKVSSSITNDVLQQKKALTANSQTTTLPGQEYMVKGGQGLKLTINKANKFKDPTKSPKPGGLGGLMKSPLGGGGMKKVLPGMKPLSALQAKLAIVTKKSTNPTSTSNKDLMKDAMSTIMKPGGGNNMSFNKATSSSSSTGSNKSDKSEDLTKKLFLPGSVKSLESGTFSSPPIFDPNKFQIPKKARSNNNNTNTNNSNSSSSESSSSNNKASGEKDVGSSSTLSNKIPLPTSTTSIDFPSTAKEKSQQQHSANTLSTTTGRTPTPTPMEVDKVQDIVVTPEIVSAQQQQLPSVNNPRPEPPSLIDLNTIMMMEGGKMQNALEKSAEPDSTTGFSISTTAVTASSESSMNKGLSTTEMTTKQQEDPETKEEATSAIMEENSITTTKTMEEIVDNFASPESPDPVNLVVNNSTPQTIPTTPTNPIVVATSTNEESPKTTPSAVASSSSSSTTQLQLPEASPIAPAAPTVKVSQQPQQQSPQPLEEIDEDRLIIDDGLGGDSEAVVDASSTNDKEIEPVLAASSSSGTDVPVENADKSTEEKSKSPEMPPPPAPVDLSSNNSSSSSTSTTQQQQTLAPPASPKAVASPLGGGGGGTTTMSIASVHIVHSPQQPIGSPSPALLRSPLVQVSASPAASPYQIDDDLMDEALIGGNPK